MQIQLNTDHHIVGSPQLQERVEQMLTDELKHLADALTRIEVHLNDVNSGKSGEDDKRCQLEARLAGMPPVSVEHRAATLELAINGAAAQLSKVLQRTLDKADTNRKRATSVKHVAQDQPDT